MELASGETIVPHSLYLDFGADSVRGLMLRHARRVARSTGTLHSPCRNLYCTWYYYGADIDRREVLENLRFIVREHLPFDVFQIDMGWENNPGGGNDWNYQPGGGSSGGSGDNSGSFSGEGENNYTWIDTDGDGIADSVLLDDVDVTGNSGNSGNSDSSDNSSEVPPYFPPINPDTPGGPNPGDITLPPYGGGGYTPSDPILENPIRKEKQKPSGGGPDTTR